MAADSTYRLRRILYVTDFLPAAQAALPYAAQLARAAEALLFVAHVIEGHPWDTSPELTFQNRMDAVRLLDQTLARPELHGVKAQYVLRHGGVVSQLLRIAQEDAVDLMVTGTRAPHGLDLLFGSSVAGQLAQSAPCPLLTVGPRARKPANDASLRNIVLATGINPGAAAGISYARAFAQAHGAKLWVAHSLRPGDSLLEGDAARKWLRKLVPDQPFVERVTEVGSVEHVTLALAERESADLVMLAPGLGPLLPEIVRLVQCPVMAVRYAIPMIRPKSFGAETITMGSQK